MIERSIPSYNLELYQNSEKRNAYLEKKIKEFQKQVPLKEIDTIVGCGHSGALIVPELAFALDLKWALVAKPNTNLYGRKIVGQINRVWVFVDDLISMGKTRRHTKRTVEESSKWIEFRGQWLYNSGFEGFGRWYSDETCDAVSNKFETNYQYMPKGFKLLYNKFSREKLATEVAKKFVESNCDSILGFGIEGILLLPYVSEIIGDAHWGVVRNFYESNHHGGGWVGSLGENPFFVNSKPMSLPDRYNVQVAYWWNK